LLLNIWFFSFAYKKWLDNAIKKKEHAVAQIIFSFTCCENFSTANMLRKKLSRAAKQFLLCCTFVRRRQHKREWPSGLRRWLQCAPTPVRSQLRVAFFFGQSRCPERKSAIPHPGMADTYKCPIQNSAKHKHSRVKTHRSKPNHHHNTTLQIANGHRCWA